VENVDYIRRGVTARLFRRVSSLLHWTHQRARVNEDVNPPTARAPFVDTLQTVARDCFSKPLKLLSAVCCATEFDQRMPGKRKRPYSDIDFTLKRVFKKPCFRCVRSAVYRYPELKQRQTTAARSRYGYAGRRGRLPAGCDFIWQEPVLSVASCRRLWYHYCHISSSGFDGGHCTTFTQSQAYLDRTIR
jgi:hypothetical protein